MTIKSVAFVGIPVRDQDRALEFYTEKLGFTVFTDQPFSDKQRWIELRLPGTDTGISLFTPEGHEDRVGSFLNASFNCDNIDRTYRELREKGVECVGEPKKEHWGSFLLIKDPDGNTLCLASR